MTDAPLSKKQFWEHAKLHYFSAQKALEAAERTNSITHIGTHAQKAAAEAAAGLLALELARGWMNDSG